MRATPCLRLPSRTSRYPRLPRRSPAAGCAPLLAFALGMPWTSLPGGPGEVGAQEVPGSEPVGIRNDAPRDDALQEAIWAAAALREVLARRDYPAILSLAVANRSARVEEAEPGNGGAGNASGSGWARLASALADPRSRGLSTCRGQEDPVEGTLCALEALAPLLPPSEARLLADEGSRLLASYLTPGEPLPPGVAGTPGAGVPGGEGARLGPFQSFAESVLEGALETRGWTAVPGLLGFTPEDPLQLLLNQVPELGTMLRAHPGIATLEVGTGGALRATLTEGETLLEEYREFLASTTGSARSLLDARLLQSLAGGDPAGEVVDWSTQRAFVYLASRSAGFAGLEAGVTSRIRALGNAATDLRQEGLAFRTNVRGLGEQVAMAALSGNVFALASGVATFFQLTPGALGGGAASEVRAVRELVESLQSEMGAGFEGIDRRLDEVTGRLDRGFGRLETLVASNHREVVAELAALQGEMAALAGRVDRLDANLVAYLQAGFDRDFTRTLILCLEHRERHLPPFDEIPFDRFSGCLADLRARGSRDARDALLTDRTTPVDDRSLAEALADPSPENLARRLPLLARAAEQRLGTPAMEGGRGGANPVEWAVATQAYLAMLREWPQHAVRITTGDLEALLATGVETERILRGTEPAMEAALGFYRDGVRRLSEEAETLATRHEQAQLRRVDPSTLVTRMTAEAVGRPELPAPRRASGNVPAEVRTAAVLALETPVLVYRTTATDSVVTRNERRRLLFFGRRHDREVHVRTAMEVELRVNDGAVVKRFRTQGPPVLARIETVGGRADPEGGPVSPSAVRSVETLVADPEAHFLAEIYPGLATDNGAWTLTDPPPALLERLETRIESELRRFESVTLNRVFRGVCEMAAEAPSDAADQASMDRLRSALDQMGTARTLLRAYANLLLPAPMAGAGVRAGEGPGSRMSGSSGAGAGPGVAAASPELRTLLEGDDEEALLDRGTLCRALAAGESPLRLVWLEAEPMERIDRLTRLLQEARTEARAGVEGGGIPVSQVTATLQQVRSAIRLQEVRIQVERAGSATGSPQGGSAESPPPG